MGWYLLQRIEQKLDLLILGSLSNFCDYRNVEGKRMVSEQTHKLTLVKKYTSGAEEWLCPVCGRRFVIQWTPEYQRVVLEIGDETAIHNTGRGAMVVYRPQSEDPWLAPWEEWLENGDVENRWID
jgi:hypothetical protein